MAYITVAGFVAQSEISPALARLYEVSILAGNSRLEIDDDGAVKVEAQLQAFKAGLVYADEIRRHTGQLPPISVAFDHKGVFRRQFLREGLTNSQKRNPRLCHLRTEIIDVFGPVADSLAISLDHILVIHEDSARTHAEHVLNTVPLPAALRHRMAVSAPEHATCGASAGAKITCAAITSEYFCKAAQVDNTPLPVQVVLEVFFESAPWSEVLAYVRGLQLAHALGKKFGVRLNLVGADGAVHKGELTSADGDAPSWLMA